MPARRNRGAAALLHRRRRERRPRRAAHCADPVPRGAQGPLRDLDRDPQMLTPRGAAATAFEQAARAIAFGKKAVKEYREMERPMAKGAENYYEATYELSYADPKLISLVFTIATFSGGAHPNSARIALLFDLAAGRALKLADVLADPKTAVAEIAARCKTQLEEQAKKEDWE